MLHSSFAKHRPRKSRGRREGRVSTDTHGPRAAKKHAAEPQVQPNNRPSLRDGLTLIRALLGDRRSCPRRLRARRTADLASAPGCQDHTISPYVTARSSAKSKLRCALPRPPHPTPRVVTIAIRPSCRGGTCGNLQLICPTTQVPAPATDWHDGQFVHDVHAQTARRARATGLHSFAVWSQGFAGKI
jgi:hypothetical protein